MRFRKSRKLRQREITDIAMRLQVRDKIVPMLVPRSSGWPRVAANHNFERRIRRIRREILVGINVDTQRMIDCQQSNLIEVYGFFQRFHKSEAESLIRDSAPFVILSRGFLRRWIYATGRGVHRSFASLRMTNSFREVETIFLLNRISIQLDVLNRPRNVALPRPDPVAYYACAQHVGNEFVTLTVPYEQRWTGTPAAVDLNEVLLLISSDRGFVL